VPTKVEWQQLAECRIEDARAHLDPAVGRWAAAYYLIGYAVECGLKACILARIAAHPEDIYEDKRFSLDAWTHDFEALLKLAKLKVDRDADVKSNRPLALNWQRMREWSEDSRYLQKTKHEAEQLFEAVTNAKEGVMQWIRLHW
jgi:HEPN domain-containing protein